MNVGYPDGMPATYNPWAYGTWEEYVKAENEKMSEKFPADVLAPESDTPKEKE